ncbi:hypothetical protein V5799_025740 [Amblyomma americanum]|uniref:Uncharacterized protein n=1 Tax=Amblyomma americanum TaxID=6943 RepID=A0AAQ4E8L0_AMBAM
MAVSDRRNRATVALAPEARGRLFHGGEELARRCRTCLAEKHEMVTFIMTAVSSRCELATDTPVPRTRSGHFQDYIFGHPRWDQEHEVVHHDDGGARWE